MSSVEAAQQISGVLSAEEALAASRLAETRATTAASEYTIIDHCRKIGHQSLNRLMEYRFNEASVILPAGLVDKSLQTFTLADGKQSFNVVVSRVDLLPDEQLSQLCERLLKEWQTRLPQFRLDRRQAISIDGQAAEYFDCHWNANGRLIHQRQVVSLPDPSQPLNGLVITGSCQNQFALLYTQMFEQFVRSLRWHPGGGR